MNNGKQPINPLPSDVDSTKVECVGLTKREYFAGLALQGMLSNPNRELVYDSIEDRIKESISYSDELLKQLK